MLHLLQFSMQYSSQRMHRQPRIHPAATLLCEVGFSHRDPSFKYVLFPQKEVEARELLEYIYNKPSYLFLGQAYQRESLNKNSYLDKLYAEAGCSDSIHSWRNLLEDHSDSIDQIYDTAADLSVSVSVPFLSELVNLP